jgi:hypothetical protein
MKGALSQDELEQKVREFVEKDRSSLSAKADFHFGDGLMRVPMETRDGSVLESTFCHGYKDEKYLLAMSVQVGCASGCSFCELASEGYKRNLTDDEILDQLGLLLNTAMKRGYDVFDRPLKATFVMGGEPLANPNFVNALDRMALDIPLQTKVSTIFPDSKSCWREYEKLVGVAKSYPNTIQFQVSVNSSDESYRQGLAAIPLAGFDKIRRAGELWFANIPNLRKIDLTFTLNSETPMDADVIKENFPPEIFAIRLRDYVPTRQGRSNNIKRIETARISELRKRLEDKGYFFVPGLSKSVEQEFSLAPGEILKFYEAMKTGKNC